MYKKELNLQHTRVFYKIDFYYFETMKIISLSLRRFNRNAVDNDKKKKDSPYTVAELIYCHQKTKIILIY